MKAKSVVPSSGFIYFAVSEILTLRSFIKFFLAPSLSEKLLDSLIRL